MLSNSKIISFHCCEVATTIIWKQKEGEAEYEAGHKGVKYFLKEYSNVHVCTYIFKRSFCNFYHIIVAKINKNLVKIKEDFIGI